jgi:hypothetical protein
MNPYWRNICTFLLIFLNAPFLMAQSGIKVPDPSFRKMRPDSLGIFHHGPLLPLRTWNNFHDAPLELERNDEDFNINQYVSPDHFPSNPFEIDLRYTSNYVPREVRDELNRIMDRPRDGAFIPVLPVAFLAIQLAGQYLLIRKKTEITSENIEKAQKALPVLELLWIQSPQTLTELYQKERIQNNHTMRELQGLIDLLIENNLVRTRFIDNAETKYYTALNQAHFQELKRRSASLEHSRPDSSMMQEDIKK